MGDKAPIDALSNALYASCATRPIDTLFFQKDLEALKIVPKEQIETLLKCTQHLTKKGLFKVLQQDGKLCWRLVKREDASKYQHFTIEEALIFSYIESAASDGIWTRALRTKTNLHPTILNRCLKALEGKSLIKTVASAKFPTRKTYMLFGLQPSEDVTGGAFYTDGKLDDLFIAELQKFAEAAIRKRSWLVRQGGDGDDEVEEWQQQQQQRGRVLASRSTARSVMVPPPPGYRGYSTLQEITREFNESKVSNISIREAEMKQVLDLLVWDGRVVKVLKGRAFKAVFPDARMGDVENGLTQAPCGRCPVFDMCEDGGPVNAASCVYFQDWLEVGGKE